MRRLWRAGGWDWGLREDWALGCEAFSRCSLPRACERQGCLLGVHVNAVLRELVLSVQIAGGSWMSSQYCALTAEKVCVRFTEQQSQLLAIYSAPCLV